MSEQNDNPSKRLHAWVDGHVQGVGFRYFVQQNAQMLGITGWVRNLWDGRVELIAEGPPEKLEKLLSALYRGPRSSDVRGVIPEWHEATGEFSGFSLRATS